MVSAPLILDYELTEADVAQMESRVWAGRRFWLRKFAALFFAYMAVMTWDEGGWWLTAIWMLVAIELWFSPRWIFWVLRKWAFRSKSSWPVRVEFDKGGVRYQRLGTQTDPAHYDWSRLTSVEESDDGLELAFDPTYQGVFIPNRAFPSETERTLIREFIDRHHPEGEPRRAADPLDSDTTPA